MIVVYNGTQVELSVCHARYVSGDVTTLDMRVEHDDSGRCCDSVQRVTVEMTREQAKDIGSQLMHFAETGELP